MSSKVKKSVFVRLRNYFITGAIVLIPIGITIYLTLFIIKIVKYKVMPMGIKTTAPAKKLFLIREKMDFFGFFVVIKCS